MIAKLAFTGKCRFESVCRTFIINIFHMHTKLTVVVFTYLLDQL